MSTIAAHALRLRLGAGLPIVCDGDLAGALTAGGYQLPEMLGTAGAVREAPQLLSRVHHAFVASGVHLIRAATGRTTPHVLRQVGYEFRASAITARAVDLALEAAAEAHSTVAVAGVLSAMELEGEPPIADARLQAEHAEHAQRLAAAGCDALWIGPMFSLREIVAAVAAASRCGLPVIASLAVAEPGRVGSGEEIGIAARTTRAAGADVVVAEGGASLGDGERAALAIADAGVPFGCAPFLPSRTRAEKLVAVAERLAKRGARALAGGPGVGAEEIAAVVRALAPARADASV